MSALSQDTLCRDLGTLYRQTNTESILIVFGRCAVLQTHTHAHCSATSSTAAGFVERQGSLSERRQRLRLVSSSLFEVHCVCLCINVCVVIWAVRAHNATVLQNSLTATHSLNLGVATLSHQLVTFYRWPPLCARLSLDYQMYYQTQSGIVFYFLIMLLRFKYHLLI